MALKQHSLTYIEEEEKKLGTFIGEVSGRISVRQRRPLHFPFAHWAMRRFLRNGDKGDSNEHAKERCYQGVKQLFKNAQHQCTLVL